MQKVFEYKKRALKDYPGFIKNVNPEEIAKALNRVLDILDNKETLNKYINYSKEKVFNMSSFESISKNVISDINGLFDD